MTSSATATAGGLHQQSRRRSAAPALARTAAALRRVRDVVGHAARAVLWYVHQLMGDDAYRTYVEHERAAHPDHEPLSERAFWRLRHAEQDANPGSRCC